MRTIKSKELAISSEQTVSMPAGRILSILANEPTLFVLCDPDAPSVDRRFRIFGTGELFDETTFQSEYIGSFEMSGGFQGHVVEVVR